MFSVDSFQIRDDIAYDVKLFSRGPDDEKGSWASHQDPAKKKDGGMTRGLPAMLTMAYRNAQRDGHKWEIRIFEKSRDQVRFTIDENGKWENPDNPKAERNGQPTQYALPATPKVTTEYDVDAIVVQAAIDSMKNPDKLTRDIYSGK